MKPLELSLCVTKVPVTLTNGEGAALQLEMREMDASNRDRYLDRLANRVRLDTDGKPAGIKKFDGMQGELLSLCLHRPDGSLVPEAEIQKWPTSIVSQLYKAAQELNYLNREAGEVEAEIKNV